MPSVRQHRITRIEARLAKIATKRRALESELEELNAPAALEEESRWLQALPKLLSPDVLASFVLHGYDIPCRGYTESDQYTSHAYLQRRKLVELLRLRLVSIAFRAAVDSDELWKHHHGKVAAGKIYRPPAIEAWLALAAVPPAQRPAADSHKSPYMEAYKLALVEHKRTLLTKDELTRITFSSRAIRRSGQSDAELMELCPWWAGDPAHKHRFCDDGILRSNPGYAMIDDVELEEQSQNNAVHFEGAAVAAVVGPWAFFSSQGSRLRSPEPQWRSIDTGLTLTKARRQDSVWPSDYMRRDAGAYIRNKWTTGSRDDRAGGVGWMRILGTVVRSAGGAVLSGTGFWQVRRDVSTWDVWLVSPGKARGGKALPRQGYIQTSGALPPREDDDKDSFLDHGSEFLEIAAEDRASWGSYFVDDATEL
jgi:hypothetical protein